MKFSNIFLLTSLQSVSSAVNLRKEFSNKQGINYRQGSLD